MKVDQLQGLQIDRIIWRDNGSLRLSCVTLSFTTPRRFYPSALSILLELRSKLRKTRHTTYPLARRCSREKSPSRTSENPLTGAEASIAARVERSRTKTKQMEGTELTPIQDIVVRVECYVQDLMQKKGLLLFKRRGT
jgi:hypothetical protein